MINNFNYYAPTEVVFGRKTEEKTGEEVRKYGGTRVLIVYGGGSAVRSGLLARVEDNLKQAGLFYAELGGVVPNPLLSKVYEGIELGKKEKIDFLLAIGGGSVIDTAKAIAYGLAEPDHDVWDLYDHKRQAEKALPNGCVLTIAAAGSEMSDSSVITNETTGEKRGYNNDLCRCKFAIMNPELTMTVPDYQTEAGCADMQMHTMERYFTSKGNMEITDAIAEGLMRTVKKYALILHQDPQNYDARAEVMWAGALAHNNLTGCGNGGNDFASHRLEHELSGMFNVTHGAGLCAIWGSWARYVYQSCLDRFVKFAMNVHGIEMCESGEETAIRGILAQEDFYRSIGMPTSFKELGIEPTEDQIIEMAHRCSLATGGHVGSARVLNEEDMYHIYEMAARR
jgi:alcohol dehydrogenase YqhD (iron-dependent ADH family)